MNNLKDLTPKDLRSLYDLKEWVKENTSKFAGKDIGKENMLITLDYLKNSIKSSDLTDKSGWLKAINILIERQEVRDE